MLRRIRAKRAARAEKKAAKLQQKSSCTTASSSTTSKKKPTLNVKAKSIFRSSLAGKFPEAPPAASSIQPAVTLTLSQEEEENDPSSVGSSEYYALMGSTASTISSVGGAPAPFTASEKDMAEMLLGGEPQEKEMYDMKTVLLDELKELQDEIAAEKDDEAFATKVELAFCNEARAETEEELKQTKQKCLAFLSELEAKTAALTETQSELITTKEALEAASATIASNGKVLQEKDEEIAALEQALTRGKRSAQAVLGMLTLGAILSADDKKK